MKESKYGVLPVLNNIFHCIWFVALWQDLYGQLLHGKCLNVAVHFYNQTTFITNSFGHPHSVWPDWAKFCGLATYCLFALHFQLNKQLLNMVCCTYFNYKKELSVDVLDFQFELGYFGYILGYISKYWAKFCSIFWSLCLHSK